MRGCRVNCEEQRRLRRCIDYGERMKNRKQYERDVVSQMIGIYCHDNHETPKGALCDDCARLEEYARKRVDKCRYGEEKTFCAHCETHCYRPDMREKIRAVMRYAGPRMLLHHPVAAIRHLALSKQEERKIAAEERARGGE